VSEPNWKMDAGDADWERMRGLPLIAKSVSGAQRGTNPVHALLAKERRRER
jgi:hypothetical protein